VCGESRMHGGNGGDGETGHRYRALSLPTWKAPVRLWQCNRPLLARGQHATQVVVAMARELVGCMWAIAHQMPVTPSVNQAQRCSTHNGAGCQRASEEAPPRCGVTLGSVKRPGGILGPRRRQAPDGHQLGGDQPTEISVINRRV
jgi:hypothetical protein